MEKSAKPTTAASTKSGKPGAPRAHGVSDEAVLTSPGSAALEEPKGLNDIQPLQNGVVGSDLHAAAPQPMWPDLGPDSTSRHELLAQAPSAAEREGEREAHLEAQALAKGSQPAFLRDARNTDPPPLPAIPTPRDDSALLRLRGPQAPTPPAPTQPPPASPPPQARGYEELPFPPEMPSRPPKVELPHRPASGKVAPYPGRADLRDIQGLVYHAWADHPYAAYLLVRLGEPEAARAWLTAMLPQVTAALGATSPGLRLQVALSPRGLEALGVPDQIVAQLPHEMRAGMHARARILGDVSPESGRDARDEAGEFGAPDELHALVMLFAKDAPTRENAIEMQRAALLAGGSELRAVELSTPMPEQREHFGFVDGISQPFIRGLHATPRPGQDPIAAGEIVLGYPNEYNRLPHSPSWGDFDLGRNGSYVVFRKLEQHVESFWGYLTERAAELTDDDAKRPAVAEHLASKMMGRWPSGAPMALAPDYDDPAARAADRINTFGYRAEDPEGLRCPISSHVRRANPRDAHSGSPNESKKVIARHRILRRGRSFGPPLPRELAAAGKGDQRPRGLYFLCLQTSIARGFEFIQQSWLNNRGFGRLHGEADPLTSGGCPFTIPAEPVRLRLPKTPRFVTPRGGGYFFLPSLSALARIAKGP